MRALKGKLVWSQNGVPAGWSQSYWPFSGTKDQFMGHKNNALHLMAALLHNVLQEGLHLVANVLVNGGHPDLHDAVAHQVENERHAVHCNIGGELFSYHMKENGLPNGDENIVGPRCYFEMSAEGVTRVLPQRRDAFLEDVEMLLVLQL